MVFQIIKHAKGGFILGKKKIMGTISRYFGVPGGKKHAKGGGKIGKKK